MVRQDPYTAPSMTTLSAPSVRLEVTEGEPIGTIAVQQCVNFYGDIVLT